MSNNAYIYDAVRTPRGKGKADGALNTVKPVSLLAQTLNALKNRNQLNTAEVDDVMIGCVTAVGEQGGNIAKAASLFAGWDYNQSGMQLNKFCASGLQALNLAAARVASGMESVLVAGGVESMSRVPMTSDGGAMAFDPQTNIRANFVPQGISADLLASLYGVSKADADEYAILSHQRAWSAMQANAFANSLIPVCDDAGSVLLAHDEAVRPDTTVEALSNLKPSFAEMGAYGFDATALRQYPHLSKILHIHTPGNSSAIVDGAAALLVADKAFGERTNLRPRAVVRSYALVGTEPTLMLDGPTSATHKALERARLSISDIDLIEINEAFASVVIRTARALELDMDKVNVNGGAIAMGHPLGATGAILVGTLLDELERQDKQFGLVTLCAAGGIGIATIIERI